jgi:hypothetical protein
MAVHHLAGSLHSLECPPCGVTTAKFGTYPLALMSWRQITTGAEQPAALRAVPDHHAAAPRLAASRG